MKKSPAAGRSLLTSVGILFVFFTAIALVISNELIFSYLQESRVVSPLLIVIALFFFILLLGMLSVQIYRLAGAVKRKEAAIHYKLRLVMYFSAIVFISTLPTVILSANILRRAFDVWFVQDTNDSLRYGLESTLEYYQFRSTNLGSFMAGESANSLLKACISSPDQGWERLSALNKGIDVLQVYDMNGTQILYQGLKGYAIEGDKARYMTGGQVQKIMAGKQPCLVAVRRMTGIDGKEYFAVCMSVLPDDFDAKADMLTRTANKLSQYRDFGLSFPLFIFGAYVLFLVPLVMLAILLGLYVADILIGPLVQMDEAVRRVSHGDFRTRLLSRQDDAMAPFVKSFNRMVEELESSRQTIQQSERIQTWQGIAQRLAHEIKNPLTPIKLSAERILKKYQTDSPDLGKIIDESVSIIVHEVEGLSRMLGEFRDFARLPSPVPEPVSLGELVRETWCLYAGQTRVSCEIGVDDALLVEADRGQIQQVLKNLFQNAIDAMNTPSGMITVNAFGLEKGGHHFVRVQVRDNGSGMSPQVLEQIFDPYFTNKKSGTGLGLAICEKIILDHGGRIWAESQEGLGTSFFFDLRYGRRTASS